MEVSPEILAVTAVASQPPATAELRDKSSPQPSLAFLSEYFEVCRILVANYLSSTNLKVLRFTEKKCFEKYIRCSL